MQQGYAVSILLQAKGTHNFSSFLLMLNHGVQQAGDACKYPT